MAEFVYALCAITSIVCAVLLLRGYRANRTRLLFWSSLCFLALALNNAMLLLDLYVIPSVDLFVPRTAIALAGIAALLYGLIWDTH
ncbi:MAG: hypothetical protein IRZ28_00705 [Steroidobacteraceae bacterium]|nr:hypothetical protein [Steroidobacteraceae bacterium]